MKVFYSRAFKRDYRDLPKEIQAQADRQLARFVENARHPSLGVQKIQGAPRPIWEGRVTRGYRFTFEWEGDVAVLRRIGSHAIIDREAKA